MGVIAGLGCGSGTEHLATDTGYRSFTRSTQPPLRRDESRTRIPVASGLNAADYRRQGEGGRGGCTHRSVFFKLRTYPCTHAHDRLACLWAIGRTTVGAARDRVPDPQFSRSKNPPTERADHSPAAGPDRGAACFPAGAHVRGSRTILFLFTAAPRSYVGGVRGATVENDRRRRPVALDERVFFVSLLRAVRRRPERSRGSGISRQTNVRGVGDGNEIRSALLPDGRLAAAAFYFHFASGRACFGQNDVSRIRAESGGGGTERGDCPPGGKVICEKPKRSERRETCKGLK